MSRALGVGDGHAAFASDLRAGHLALLVEGVERDVEVGASVLVLKASQVGVFGDAPAGVEARDTSSRANPRMVLSPSS